jgi:hypothetical protein
MSQARHLARGRQIRSGADSMIPKRFRVKPRESGARESTLNLAMQPADFASAANSAAGSLQFLEHPEFALAASAAIAGREIGRVLVLRKG